MAPTPCDICGPCLADGTGESYIRGYFIAGSVKPQPRQLAARLLVSTAFMEEATGLLVDASVVIDADRVSVLENQLVRASVLLEVKARPVLEELRGGCNKLRTQPLQLRQRLIVHLTEACLFGVVEVGQH